MNIIFRVDASAEIGGGHFFRCLGIADVLKSQGNTCIFMSQSLSKDMEELLNQKEHGLLQLDAKTEKEEIKLCRLLLYRWMQQHGEIHTIIIDHYQRSHQWESAFYPICKRFVVIDDLANRPHMADILLDSSLGRKPIDYEKLLPEHCQVLAGAEFTPLRYEFSKCPPTEKIIQHRQHPKNKVLIAMSATDPENMTETVLSILEDWKHGPKFQFSVVLTSGAKYLANVANKVKKSPLNITLHRDVSNMRELYFKHDLAIGAAGTSAMERCVCGLPSVAIGIVDNQMFNIQQFMKANALLAALDRHELEEKLVPSIEKSASNKQYYQEVVKNGLALCDGKGILRTANAFQAELPAYRIWFRAVNAMDVKVMYEWQCHPDTRKYSRNPEPPSFEEHQLWVERNLLSSQNQLWMLCHQEAGTKEEKLGVIRISPNSEREHNEVSIYLNPAMYGQGIATRALTLLLGIYQEQKLEAYIQPDNKASVKSFLKAGFRPTKQDWYIATYESKI